MDIEKRLEYLIKKRAELQSSLLILQKESLGIEAASEPSEGKSELKVDLSTLDYDYIYQQLKSNKNKAITEVAKPYKP